MDIGDLLAGKKKKASNEKTATISSEDDVLASLGTTRAETSSYESNVLRQATHQLAPSLTVDPFLGFPDFITETSLLPFSTQKQGKANRQVVMNVLGQIQEQMKQQGSSNNMQILAMKQNILLSMLGQHSKKPAIQQLWKNSRAVEPVYQQHEQFTARRGRVSMMERKQIVIPGSISLAKAQQMTDKRRKKQVWKDWSSDEEDDDVLKARLVLVEMNYSRRTMGKQSTRRKPVKRTRKAANIAADMASTTWPRRNRTPVASYADEEVVAMEEEVEGVKKEQMEFDLRGNDTAAEGSERPQRSRTQVKSYVEKEETEADVDKENAEGGKADTLAQVELSSETDNNTKASALKEEPTDNMTETNAAETDNTETIEHVTCPLCQQVLTVTDPAMADTQLAQHMEICQQQSTSRRSSRQRAPTDGYKEVYDDEGNEIMEKQTEASARRRSKRKRTETEEAGTTAEEADATDVGHGIQEENDVNHSAEEDDQFVFDADIDDEEDTNLEADEEAVPEEVPLDKPTAIDDFLLDDYEDRVDYWRLHGVSEMRDMSRLRAEGETDPGAVTLQGGLNVPAWMNNRLFGYQRTGLEWMWTLHQQQAGGVMGDEMGLGKTVQVSSFLGAMAASRQLKGVLIISPATMLQHWLSELATWAPGLRRVLLHSSGESSTETPRSLVNQGPAIFRNLRDWLKTARKERLYEKIDCPEGEDDEEPEDSFCGTGYAIVTTFEHVRRNQDEYVGHPWSYVVMDEAQKIRNPTADITLACKRLRTPHRIAMTGTPIQNDLKELWSLFDFVFPGRLGTLPAFEEEFAAPIKRGGYSNASPVQVQLAYRCSLVLRDLIDPYLLRRRKAEIEEVKKMPSKTEHVLFCRLSKRQRRMYESFLQSDMVKKIFKGSTLLFAAVTMLRKICNHPDLVLSDPSDDVLEAFLRNGCVPEQIINSDDEDEEVEDDHDPFPDAGNFYEKRSGKFEVMAKILPLWKKQGHRVLIFSQWTKMLDIIQKFVVAQGWKFLRLDGKTNVSSRQKMVDLFNSDESYFGMLCTTRTGGVGLNLTGANKLVLYDVDWNPQTDAQARERAWRFGQEKQVTVYRLCTAGTIEEKMYQRQIFKTALTNKVLHDPRQKRLFSQKDLHDLLTLQPDNGKANSGKDTIETTERLARASRKDEGAGAVDASEVSKDDSETLKSVLKSKGLAGVFDHKFVDPSGAAGNKSQSAREMEEQAKQIAKEAAEALRSSVDTQDQGDPFTFTPTWTGDSESRFCASSGSGERRGSDSSFGGAGTAGVRNTGGGSKSSGSLLASIRQQNEAVNGKNGKYNALMARIRDYVRKHSPTSDEILDAFASVPDCDAAIFKRLLNTVARSELGRWKLR